MATVRNRLIELIESGAVPEDRIAEALAVTGVRPGAEAWVRFLDRLLAWLGGLALAASLIFFIAWNWTGMGRVGRFALAEGALALAVLAFCRFGRHSLQGKVALTAAVLALGALLALFGQTYQTGADTSELFMTWAVLMLPWVILGRFPALWILWIAVVNTATLLYFQAFPGIFGFMFGSGDGALWSVFILNSLVLAAWEILARPLPWLSVRWAPRLLAAAGGAPATLLLLGRVFEMEGIFIPLLAWAVWLAALLKVYRRRRQDLFMLAAGCVSAMTVATGFLARTILEQAPEAGLLFIGLAVIAMGGGAALWLKSVHGEKRP